MRDIFSSQSVCEFGTGKWQFSQLVLLTGLLLKHFSILTASFLLLSNLSRGNENIFSTFTKSCCRAVKKQTSASQCLNFCGQREWQQRVLRYMGSGLEMINTNRVCFKYEIKELDGLWVIFVQFLIFRSHFKCPRTNKSEHFSIFLYDSPP